MESPIGRCEFPVLQVGRPNAQFGHAFDTNLGRCQAPFSRAQRHDGVRWDRMPRSPQAVVTPAALKWARESDGYTIEEAARRVSVSSEKLDQAERGEHMLTMRQAEAAARAYDRPLAALFMPEPPDEEPPEAQFRRLPGAPHPPWPHEMRVLARRVRDRQDAAVELYELLDEPTPWTSVEIAYSADPEELARGAREVLGIPLHEQRTWQDRTGYRPLREWVDAVEALGTLVMQDGSLPVERVRGFASTHPQVPAIVVNTNDDPRARLHGCARTRPSASRRRRRTDRCGDGAMVRRLRRRRAHATRRLYPRLSCVPVARFA